MSEDLEGWESRSWEELGAEFLVGGAIVRIVWPTSLIASQRQNHGHS